MQICVCGLPKNSYSNPPIPPFTSLHAKGVVISHSGYSVQKNSGRWTIHDVMTEINTTNHASNHNCRMKINPEEKYHLNYATHLLPLMVQKKDCTYATANPNE